MKEKTFTVMKTLRLTTEEERQLKRRCKELGMKEAEYFRFLLSQKPRDYPTIRILMKELINEMNAIGRNINQITHNHNAALYSEVDKRHLFAYMQKLNRIVMKVVEQLGNY